MSGFLSRVSKMLRFGRAQYYAGKDLQNNKYYEYPSVDGNTDPRRTRRLIRYREEKDFGEHEETSLPAQWVMWLRHTRRSAPSVEELLADQERIRITRHNAAVLAQKDADRKLYLQQKAAEEVKKTEQLEGSISDSVASHQRNANTSSGRATAVPTSTVNDEQVDQDGTQEGRKVDMEVWEASRRRVEEQSARQGREQKRADMNSKDAERDRARRAMSRSPLEDYDVSYEDDEIPPKATGEQIKPPFGRPQGAGQEWAPNQWNPAPVKRR